MRALRFHGRRDVRLDEIEPPGPPGPHEIQVVPAWSGICGSDIHEYLAGPLVMPTEPHPLTGCKLPITLGHEASGVVAAIGSEVTTHRPGDRVFINPTVSCGSCYSCKDLDCENVCQRIGFLGVHAHTGAFAELMNFEARRGILLPPDLPLDIAAVLEPVMVAKHAARRAGVQPHHTVLIVGCGPVGLGLLLVCLKMGVKRVIVSELSAKRIALAKEFGAHLVCNPREEDVVGVTLKETNGLGADFAFDISGNAASLRTAVQSIRIQGTVGVVALFEGTIEFAPNELLLMEKSIKWMFAYSEQDIRDVVREFGADPAWRKRIEAMITLRLGLTEAVAKGYHGIIDHRDDHIKVLITSDRKILE